MRSESFKLNSSAQQHLLPKLNYQDLENGELIRVFDKKGRFVDIDLRRLCPDGDLLTSKNKSWICSPIRDFIKRYADNVTGTQVRLESLVSEVNEQFIWAYWLIDKGYSDPLFMTSEILEEFLVRSARGLDDLINSRAKVWRVLVDSEKRYGSGCIKDIKISEVIGAAGIPIGWRPHLPGAALAIRQYRNGEAELPEWQEAKPLSVGTLHRRGVAVKNLYSELSEDELIDVMSIAERAGTLSEPTKLIPSDIGMRLLDQAVLWVMEINPTVLQFIEDWKSIRVRYKKSATTALAREKNNLLSKMNERLEAYLPTQIISCPSRDGKGRISLNPLIRVLVPTACAIVAGAFTARRAGELESLRSGACVGDEVTGYWIKTYIEKTLQRDDLTPCPRIVAEAVRQLEILSADWRQETGGEHLFAFRFTGIARASEFHLRENMNKFAAIVGATSYVSNGRNLSWIYSPRQLRKLFAVLYVWRYDAGDIYALSYHLRHFSISTTLGYCRDAELSREIAAQVAELTLQKIEGIVHGVIKPVGVYGKRLTALINRFLGTIRLITEQSLKKELARLICDRKITLKATPWGYCSCSSAPSHLRRAACQKEDWASKGLDADGTPDATGSDETRCAGCLFFVTDQTRASWWDRACESTEAILKDPGTSRLQRVRYEKRLQVLLSMRRAIGEVEN